MQLARRRGAKRPATRIILGSKPGKRSPHTGARPPSIERNGVPRSAGSRSSRVRQFCSGCGASLRGVTDAHRRYALRQSGRDDRRSSRPRNGRPTARRGRTTGAVPVTTAPPPERRRRSSRASVARPPTAPVADADVWAVDRRRPTARGAPDRRGTDPVANGRDADRAPPAAPPARSRFRFGAVMLCGILAAIVALDRHVRDRGGGHQRHAPRADRHRARRLPDRHVDARRPRRQHVDRDPDRGRAAGRGGVGRRLPLALGIGTGRRRRARLSPGWWRWRSGSPSSRSTPPASSRAIPNAQQFTLTITRDVGYWLLLACGGAGDRGVLRIDQRRLRRPPAGPQPVDRRARRARPPSSPCSGR